jgi:hypothetical protein
MQPSEKDDHFQSLKWSLQALAAVPSEQPALFPEYERTGNTLARDFDNWSAVVCANYEDDLSHDQRQALAAINQRLSAMSDDDPDVWSQTALIEDERWDEIRRLACAALDTFGWAIEPAEDISSAAAPPE